jgi:hypothetical protein
VLCVLHATQRKLQGLEEPFSRTIALSTGARALRAVHQQLPERHERIDRRTSHACGAMPHLLTLVVVCRKRAAQCGLMRGQQLVEFREGCRMNHALRLEASARLR